jgi:hypothetical protein
MLTPSVLASQRGPRNRTRIVLFTVRLLRRHARRAVRALAAFDSSFLPAIGGGSGRVTQQLPVLRSRGSRVPVPVSECRVRSDPVRKADRQPRLEHRLVGRCIVRRWDGEVTFRRFGRRCWRVKSGARVRPVLPPSSRFGAVRLAAVEGAGSPSDARSNQACCECRSRRGGVLFAMVWRVASGRVGMSPAIEFAGCERRVRAPLSGRTWHGFARPCHARSSSPIGNNADGRRSGESPRNGLRLGSSWVACRVLPRAADHAPRASEKRTDQAPIGVVIIAPAGVDCDAGRRGAGRL